MRPQTGSPAHRLPKPSALARTLTEPACHQSWHQCQIGSRAWGQLPDRGGAEKEGLSHRPQALTHGLRRGWADKGSGPRASCSHRDAPASDGLGHGGPRGPRAAHPGRVCAGHRDAAGCLQVSRGRSGAAGRPGAVDERLLLPHKRVGSSCGHCRGEAGEPGSEWPWDSPGLEAAVHRHR